MAQIRTKQLKLSTQGDLILANASANGTNLAIGSADQALVSNGTTAAWISLSASNLTLTEGDIFIGNASDIAAEATASSEGQVLVSGSGPFDLSIGTLAADFVSFTASSANNIVAIDVQTAIVEAASERSYVYVGAVDPASNNDGVDNASLGEIFKIGDIWVNTVSDNVWQAVDVSSNAAVWVRAAGVAGVFVYKGDTDASNSGTLPSTPTAGDWYRINVIGGTNDFNGAWDAAGEPDGATFAIGDAIVYGDDGAWHKIDNTDPTVTEGNGIDVTAGPNFIVSVDADEVTITTTGGLGTELSVYGGTANQVLIGQGASSDASWGFMDDLRDSSGNLIVDGVGSTTPVNNLKVSNSDTSDPVIIETVGSDTNIDLTITAKGLGRIDLDGTLWPTGAAPVGSILVANSSGDLSYETSPDGSGDQVLIYNDTTNTLEWVVTSTIGGNAFGTVLGDSGSAIADSTSDTVTIVGGEAITTIAEDTTDTLTVDLDIPSLTADASPDGSTDFVVTYDDSAGTHKKVLLEDLPGGGGGGNAWTTVTDGTVNADADSASDTLTFTGTEGIDLTVSDTPETITAILDIDGLTTETGVDTANDQFVFYDASATTHRKLTLDDLTGDFGGTEADAEKIASGGVNETFTTFFPSVPISDGTITVFFNGVKLRDTGWTRSSQNLTLDDTVNGYSTDAGDVISAKYDF